MENPFEAILAEIRDYRAEVKEVIDKSKNEHGLDKDEFLRLEPAAEYLGVKASTLRSYINQKVIVYYKRSTMIYLKKSDLNEYIEQGKVEKKNRFLRSA